MVDQQALARQALGKLRRAGVCQWVEAEELLSVGTLAIITSGVTDEAFAVHVAHSAMCNAIDRYEVRQRGRVQVREGHEFTCGGEEPSMGDMWDATVYRKQGIQPAARHYDLWEAMRALPARQYQAITLTFWGGMCEETVGVEMGISQQAVHAMLERAKINIRKGVVISQPQLMTNMRGKETQRTVPSGRKEVA